MIVVTVARKPLSESSVAANVLKHGTGAINVDAARIDHTESADFLSNRSGRKDGNAWANMGINGKPHSYEAHNAGRWPANLVLQHKPGCRCVGTQEAKQLTAGRRTVRWGVGKGGDTYEKGTGAVFATEDGKEMGLVWDCEPGCPVADLDGRTEDLQASKGKYIRKHGDTQFLGALGDGRTDNPTGVADSGGASRFFKQVGGKPVSEE